MKYYPAKSLFGVHKIETYSHKKEEVRATFPFDLRFKIIKEITGEFKGPGVYCIAFRENVVYIGSYRSQKPMIINQRWINHIMTLTNRGYRVGFNSKKKQHLIPDLFKPFFERDKLLRYRDTGVVTTIERLEFAANYFADFEKLNDENLISDFIFYYRQLDETQNAVVLEKQLINEFQPICNVAGIRSNEKRNISIDEINSAIIKLAK